MLKLLKSSGVRIRASREQADELHKDGAALESFLDVSDTETSSISTATAPALEVAEEEEQAPRKRGRPPKALLEDEAEEDDAKSADEFDVHSPFADKFISLSALIPPLPKKGDFKVETIKKSQYFFS